MSGVVVTSKNGRVGIPDALVVLREGGSAVDAAVAAVRAVEDDRSDDGVGTGGLPNVMGDVELDAAVMDGRTLAAGAVAALRRFPHPVEVARKVLETMPHVLLTGEGAATFARIHGFVEAELLTQNARRRWQERIKEPVTKGNPAHTEGHTIEEWTRLLHPRLFGTTNALVLDDQGDLAVAVSTSGWGFKWPGRVGDTPVVGAGFYADNAIGAAACTGMGELAMRSVAAFRTVDGMRTGSAQQSLENAIRELGRLRGFHSLDPIELNVITLTHEGEAFGVSTLSERSFLVQRSDGSAVDERAYRHVQPEG